MPRLNAAVELTAYFVVAEALTNVLKHAAPEHVEVRLGHRQNQLTVRVSDNGRGGAVLSGHGGLAGLRDRARALDGDLSVVSDPGQGTVVSAWLPLSSAAAK